MEALAPEPGRDQQDPKSRVEHWVLAGQHLPGGQDQTVAGRDQRASAVGQEGDERQPADPIPLYRVEVDAHDRLLPLTSLTRLLQVR